MTDAQRQLHQALKAHQSELEIERDAASDRNLEERIEATGRVLKWLEQATFRQAARRLHAASGRKFAVGE
jgi:DNA-binding MurR/RpiR family transcriptional regulator